MQKLFVFTLIMALLALTVSCAPGSAVQIMTPVPNPQAATPAPGQINLNVPAVSIQLNAPGANPLENKPNSVGQVASALMGVWHGLISPVTLLVSFVNRDVQMYEVHNDGSPYNLGFLIGMLILLAIAGLLIGARRGR